jgi:LysM repeat protein
MKMTLPTIFAAKPKKKVRATAARKPLRIAATADYDEMAEPNMKLSRALLIVLVLHVVAVSGIIAFNAIKTRHGGTWPAPAAASAPARPAPSASALTSASDAFSRNEAKPARSPVKPGKEERKSEHARPNGVMDSGKTYAVAKGDTPLSIAKKLKVPYDDLLAINHIDDPHKLRVGQKLILPSKPPKAKKVQE